jgi:6-phosphofructokinase 1
MLTPEATAIETLGPREVSSPLQLSTVYGDGMVNFIADEARMPLCVERRPNIPGPDGVLFEKAGPREHIFFEPSKTKAAIVTCGGLCPGLNNVIRSIFLELHYHYQIKKVLGIRYGYSGLDPDVGEPPLELTPAVIEDIHKEGGTVLGSSRGPVEPAVAISFLRDRRINVLFCIGGDGTQRGAHALAREAQRQNYPLSVVGIPKTIDNDISFVYRTFGFYTALEIAHMVINCAHTEAHGAPNGVAIVKLMGRDAGFIAAGATIASQDVNFCLIPEVPFALDGEGGLLDLLTQRVLARKHAVIVVAEGAGQYLLPTGSEQRDASGNLLHQDIGPFLKQSIQNHFKAHDLPANVKYIDPSYIIRSVPADTEDSLLCDALARNAVHAAMAGKTNVLIGLWYNVYIHVPIDVAVRERKHLSPESEMWRGVLAATGQPPRIGQPESV